MRSLAAALIVAAAPWLSPALCFAQQGTLFPEGGQSILVFPGAQGPTVVGLRFQDTNRDGQPDLVDDDDDGDQVRDGVDECPLDRSGAKDLDRDGTCDVSDPNPAIPDTFPRVNLPSLPPLPTTPPSGGGPTQPPAGGSRPAIPATRCGNCGANEVTTRRGGTSGLCLDGLQEVSCLAFQGLTSFDQCGISCPRGFHPVQLSPSISCNANGTGPIPGIANAARCELDMDVYGQCGTGCSGGSEFHVTSRSNSERCRVSAFGALPEEGNQTSRGRARQNTPVAAA